MWDSSPHPLKPITIGLGVWIKMVDDPIADGPADLG